MLSPERHGQLTLLNTVVSLSILVLLLSQQFKADEGLQPDVVTIGGSDREAPAEVATSLPTDNLVEVQDVQEVANTEKLPEVSSGPSGAVGLKLIFEATMEPLVTAANDHQEESTLYIPTEAELEAALQSEGIDSAETVLILDKMKAGYEKFNMPFPSFNLDKTQDSQTKLDPSTRASVPVQTTDGPKVDVQAIRSYLLPTIERLQIELTEKGELGGDYLPTEEEVTTAINSGTFESNATTLVIGKLRKGFLDTEIDFPEPGTISVGEAPPEPTEPVLDEEGSPSSVSNNQSNMKSDVDGISAQQIIIVKAYFEGQLQRVSMIAEEQSKDISTMLPTEEEISQAAETGKIESPESLAAIAKLSAAYSELDVNFNPPVVSQ